VQATSTETVGDSHKLAVCVHNMPENIHGFYLSISYDDELDGCTEEDCPAQGTCLDDNPDANAGTTTWGDSLGDQWDCDIEGEPVCHEVYTAGDALDTLPPEGGFATIWCRGDGNVTSGPLAVLDLSVLGAGTDNVEISSLTVYGDDEVAIARCGGLQASPGITGAAFPMICNGATDIKESGETHKRKTKTPTPAPTETATPVPPTVPPPPPATATPLGGVGPEIVAPATGSGSPVGGFTWAIWLAAGIAGAAAAAGFYFRYAKKAR
jgi:hypothetical protein